MSGEKELCILAALCAAFAASAATSVKTDRFDRYGNPKPLMTVFTDNHCISIFHCFQ